MAPLQVERHEDGGAPDRWRPGPALVLAEAPALRTERFGHAGSAERFQRRRVDAALGGGLGGGQDLKRDPSELARSVVPLCCWRLRALLQPACRDPHADGGAPQPRAACAQPDDQVGALPADQLPGVVLVPGLLEEGLRLSALAVVALLHAQSGPRERTGDRSAVGAGCRERSRLRDSLAEKSRAAHPRQPRAAEGHRARIPAPAGGDLRRLPRGGNSLRRRHVVRAGVPPRHASRFPPCRHGGMG
mmetsp:Transcript_65872/g.196038  ORF Transcript_65872/g.196038 Transcript_65872/m.196038 type:complete len:246 (-) Transcript_65872:778-1515(-)